MSEKLSKALQKAVEDSVKDTEGNLLELLKASAEECVSFLKRTSPRSNRKGRHYANGWTFEIDNSWKGIKLNIYNKTKPNLTHILNDGFRMRNGQFHKGDGHINKAEEKVVEMVESGLSKL